MAGGEWGLCRCWSCRSSLVKASCRLCLLFGIIFVICGPGSRVLFPYPSLARSFGVGLDASKEEGDRRQDQLEVAVCHLFYQSLDCRIKAAVL